MKLNKAVISIGVVLLLGVVAMCGVATTMFMTILTSSSPAEAACGSSPAVPASADPGSTAPFGQWDAQQVAHAVTIVAAGKKAEAPARGWVIAVATAMQESSLRNQANSNVPRSLTIPHDAVGHDHDSVGLFQQRPNPPDGEGTWGTVEDLMTPAISAGKFYNALLQVRGWQQMELTDAAQAVQKSAAPEDYADDEAAARALVAHVAGVANVDDIGGGPPGAECGAQDAGSYEISPSGWTQPVKATIGAGWGEDRGDHRHAGVDLIAAKNTPLRAAAAGKVIVSKCNAPEWYGCDKDGYPGLGGCGWYVEIEHPGGIHTRYCHMVRQPMVAVGAEVQAGQQIGNLGSSGNSSGPHLHFEVHVNMPPGSIGSWPDSVDPIPFMQQMGAPLG
jgi:murein DD-endopeptidase MepM/ murein hydrolase activator NlpD